MVFSSYVFLFLFLPAVLLGYYLLPGRGALRTWWLATASYVFYGWSGPAFCVWMAASTAVDLLVAWGLERARTQRARRRLLVLSLVFNLGLLGTFKYLGFVLASLSAALIGLGVLDAPLPDPELPLPVGISFYTFQSLSYSIDVYRGHVPAVRPRRTIDFVCFVALFPQLVAGPIVRFGDLRRQLVARRHDLERFATGCAWIGVGLGKKVLLGDGLAGFADAAFALESPGLIDSWAGVLAMTLRIYFDFSGYSDMAVGLGLLFGFTLPVNFDAPFRAGSIGALWRRWNSTLTSWLRDYVYYALPGSRTDRRRADRNLAITFLLCGLWHGAAWHFVAFGAYHAAIVLLERAQRRPWALLPRPLRAPWTFVLWMFGVTLFAGADCGRALALMAGMVGASGLGELTIGGARSAALPLATAAVGLGIVAFAPTTQRLVAARGWGRTLLALACFTASAAQLLSRGFQPMVYFRF
ncbi:MAG: MBOAT family protein [Planctomycetota bacterium]